MDPHNGHKHELLIEGVPASPGVVHGDAFVYLTQHLDIPRYEVGDDAHGSEVARFEQALLETRRQICDIKKEVADKLGEDEARIFDAHLLVLEDVALIDETVNEQKQSGLNIETCFQGVSQKYIEAFQSLDDDYIKERISDIKDVASRLISVLLGLSPQNLSQLNDNRVIVAEDLPPSDTATMDRTKVLAIVTDAGSRTSHAVIMARSLQVPAVVGLHDITQKVQLGDHILVDGYNGCVYINPSQETLDKYGKIELKMQSLQQVFETSLRDTSKTKDGREIRICANIGRQEEVDGAIKFGAEGIGLFRTESLFLGRSHLPDEEEQFRLYKNVAEQFSEKTVTIRTLDLGGDKVLKITSAAHREENPFMGLRGIRVCLAQKSLFKSQLKAILRAATTGNIRLMYPMISGLEEIELANELLSEAREELEHSGVEYAREVEIGIMIEVPSAALVADQLAKYCKFFSIGTNDLIQYLLAVDRVNDRVAHLYQPCHPAILRAIQMIMQAGNTAGIKVSVCGEMAGDPLYFPLLAGLGANELSMTPLSIPEVKYMLTHSNYSAMQQLSSDLLKEEVSLNVKERLGEYYTEFMKDLL